MNDEIRLKRLEYMAQIHIADIHQLVMQSTELQIDLRMKDEEIQRLTAALTAANEALNAATKPKETE